MYAEFESKMPRDDATMRLAHPQRCAVCLAEQSGYHWSHLLGQRTWQALSDRFKEQSGMTGDILAELTRMPEHWRLETLTEALAQGPGSSEMGSAFAVMLYARHTVSPQPQFLVDDDLVEILHATDISDDLPVSTLSLPYPRCYIELGRSRTLGLSVPNPATGLHVLEGAYMETCESDIRGPGIFVMLTGSPLGKENAMDDATASLFISTRDPQQPLRAALQHAKRDSARLAEELGLVPDMAEHFEHEFECLKMLAKVLLYLNLPEARKTLHKDFTLAKAAVQAKKNPAKRAKAERELRALSDYILVSAPPMQREAGEPTDGRSVKAHWRRGHYRLQAHGPQHSLRKVIFVQPVLVGSLEGAAVPQYRVKA